MQSIKELTVRLQQEDIEPWQLGTSNEEEMRIELTDSIHDISKYTVVVNSAHWPVPDKNPLYKENKRSVKNIDVVDLLRWIESSAVCDGLAEDGEVRSEVMSIAVDPTEMPGPSPHQLFGILCPNPLELKTLILKYPLHTGQLVARFSLVLNIQ